MIADTATSTKPRRRKKGQGYPPEWPAVALAIKEAAGWRCARCQHPHDPAAGYCLTVHHLTNRKDEPLDHWWALVPLCQRCHLAIQARVKLERPWVLTEHSEWAKPFIAGWYAWRYLGVNLPRETVMARLDELLDLERRVVLGGEMLR